MSITQPVCVVVTLGIKHAIRMRHIVICGLPDSTVFSHIISQKARFSRKKKKNMKCVFRVFTQLLSEIFFHSKKKWARYDRKCLLVFMLSALWSYPILMKFEFSQQIFRKILKYKNSWQSVQREPSCSIRTDVQTDRHDEANSRFSQFCERAKKRTSAIPLQSTSKCKVAKTCTLHGDRLCFFVFNNNFRSIIL
jgi:hypothetical protein